ncbi:MAG: 4Fe-4S dicluster domain-containing protein, partial [Armatimonadota bacterium]
MGAKLRDIFAGLWSLIVGLGVSRKTGFEPAVTEQYPDAIFNRPFKRHGVPHRQVAERFRGLRGMRWDWEHEITACIACRSCERACPSKCIYGIESEGRGKTRRATAFTVDLFQCCFCGLCVDVCP